jgi:hypothetical protein
MLFLQALANLASILTALVAAGAAMYYWLDARSKRQRLEAYLQTEKERNPGKHTHTVVHLMAELGMTEAEILRGSFASLHVVHKTRKDYDTGLAAQLLFEYSEVPKER